MTPEHLTTQGSAFKRVRLGDIPACARALADAYGPADVEARRRTTQWTTAFYVLLLWLMPHHYHRDHQIVVGLRRRSISSALRTAAAWTPFVIVLLLLAWASRLGSPVGPTALVVIVVLAVSLTTAAVAFRRNSTGPRPTELAPRADWIVFDLGARHSSRAPSTLLDVRCFLRRHISAEQTVGAVAHDQKTARAYEAVGLHPITPGSLRMIGTLRR